MSVLIKNDCSSFEGWYPDADWGYAFWHGQCCQDWQPKSSQLLTLAASYITFGTRHAGHKFDSTPSIYNHFDFTCILHCWLRIPNSSFKSKIKERILTMHSFFRIVTNLLLILIDCCTCITSGFKHLSSITCYIIINCYIKEDSHGTYCGSFNSSKPKRIILHIFDAQTLGPLALQFSLLFLNGYINVTLWSGNRTN